MREGLRAATRAETMLDCVLVEPVTREIALATRQAELTGRKEGEKEALAPAMGAIAR